MLSAISLDTPTASCIPITKIQEEWGLVNGEASPVILHDQPNDIHSRDSSVLLFVGETRRSVVALQPRASFVLENNFIQRRGSSFCTQYSSSPVNGPQLINSPWLLRN
jgi:hypothetical protein